MTATLTLDLDATIAWLRANPIFGGTSPTQMGISSTGDALVTHTIDGVDLNDVWATVIEGFNAHNAHRTAISDLLSFRTTVPGEAIPQGVSSPPMEKLSEYGIPNAANVPSNVLMLGYDFGDFGLRSSFTWQALRLMTAEQVYAHVNTIMHSDNRLVTGTILKRLFDPVNKTNAEGIQCRGLYSADGQIPPDYLGRTFDGTENHYLKSGASQIDSADIEDAIKMIRQKGYGREAGSQILILASEIESEHIQTFRQGEESRPSSSILARHSFIPSKRAPSYITPDNIVGEPIDGTYHGVECLGSYGPAWLVQTEFIPAGYVAVVVSGGPNSIGNVVGVREHPIESYRGLLAVPGLTAYPITDSTYIRSFGVGVRQRGAAVAIQIGSGSTYVAPTIAA